MKKISLIVLTLIVLIAIALRFWTLGNIPISPDWDEVALGYNAYSITHIGKDEYGKNFPIVLRSFDDYKPALYSYLTIPSISFFGLSVFAVRFPSAIFGVITVILTYFLVKEFFNNKESKRKNIPEAIALLTAFLLAISPWHIQFSRTAFEANVGLAFSVASILFFLMSFKRPLLLSISSILLSLNLYVYQSEKVLTPLLLIILVLLFKGQLLKFKKKYLIFALFLGLLISLPLIFFSVTNNGVLSRARGVSIFFDKTVLPGNDLKKFSRDKLTNNKIGMILDHRFISYTKMVAANYLSHYDFNWLFIKGDFQNNRHHAPNMGLLYLFELPFLLIGIYIFIFSDLSKEINKRYKILTILFLLVIPIPASITKDVPHAIRALHFLPFLQIFIAFGIAAVFLFVKQKFTKAYMKYLLIIVVSLSFVLNFLYFLDQYFVQLNYYYAKDWQYGYKELIDYLKPVHKNYKKIIVSNRLTFDQSYMFFLFYLRYDPQEYLKEGGTSLDRAEGGINKFSNFEFRSFNYYQEKDHNILLVGSPDDFLEIFKTIKTINYPDGSLAVRVVEKD